MNSNHNTDPTPTNSRRRFLQGSALTLGAAIQTAGLTTARAAEPFQYDDLHWIDEREDPSIRLETEELVVNVIDNSGLKVQPGKIPGHGEPDYSHWLGYHGIRSLWNKTERRNVVAPFYSWLNLQGLRVDGLELDPVDSRARSGVGRGWPMQMQHDGEDVVLRIPPMPVSGIEYSLRLRPAEPDAIDFEVSFTLHRKTKVKAEFIASWPCYMSALDDVRLFAPVGDADRPEWQAIGEKEDFVVGEAVNYVHKQRTFWAPAPAAFPAVYGRIGSRVLALMVSRPEVRFYLVNAGGHRAYFPVQNPAWDFQLKLPDYEVDKPFGLRGRLIYKTWTDDAEITTRYRDWKRSIEG